MHKLVRRVSAASVPSTASPAVTAQIPQRRLRVTSNRLDQRASAKEQILASLKSISDCDAAIDRAVAEREAELAKIEALMKEHRLPPVENGVLIAELKEKFSRQQTSVDPKKFRNAVAADTFWSCIDVSVTRAKEHMGERELLGISDVKKAESKGVSLEVREVKKSRR